MSTLNSRLQLSILNRKKSKNLAEKGFTLIELLITVVILGTLSAIALPNFLGVKDAADGKSAIASATALAKECSTAIVADLPAPNQTQPKGVTISGTCGSAGRNYAAGSVADPLKLNQGELCITDVAAAPAANATNSADTICTVTVDADGAVTGAFS